MLHPIWKKNCFIAPSLITLDHCNLEQQIRVVEQSGIDLVHIDILDGHFSPSLPLGIDTVMQLRRKTELPFDAHIMVTEPDYFVDAMLDIGVEQLTLQCETTPHLDRWLNHIKSRGVRAGVALKPATPLSSIDYALEIADCILLMLINPGFAGASTERQVPYAARKILELRGRIDARGTNTMIELDGRVSIQDIEQYGGQTAQIFVAGSTCIDRTHLAESLRFLSGLQNEKQNRR